MMYYYFGLAMRSLKRNLVLTALMIAAIGVGIGASMTTLTLFRAMATDPIPQKSRQLFTLQIGNWPPNKVTVATGDEEHLQQQISYPDAVALMNAHAGRRQSAMYHGGRTVIPANSDLKPFEASTRAAYTDFFRMFDVPFVYGEPWPASDDANHSDVVVLSRELNDKLFGGANSVGKTVDLDGRGFRVVGVAARWNPVPRFFDLNTDKYGKTEQMFIPFTTAIDEQMEMWGNFNCDGDVGTGGWEGRIHSECVWVQYWVELPAAADVARYRSFLTNYAIEQRRSGRFHWQALTRLRNVREWLAYNHVVSDEARILVLVSFSFLFVCLLNAMGLMLAKIMGRSGDIAVRRALGASRGAVFMQCLTETAVVGLAGGLLGLGLTSLGLFGLRALLSDEISRLSSLDAVDITIAVVLAVVATTLAGLYPTWRATRIQPAWQLKAQ
jgi:putative ABC transport system permease protein